MAHSSGPGTAFAVQTRSIMRVMGSDRAGLIIIGSSVLIKGVSYFPPLKEPSRVPSHWVEHFFPLEVIGVVWIAVGLLCFAAMWCRRLEDFAWPAAIGLHTVWALSFTTNWLLYSGRAWVSALSYLTILALIMWGLARSSQCQDCPYRAGR